MIVGSSRNRRGWEDTVNRDKCNEFMYGDYRRRSQPLLQGAQTSRANRHKVQWGKFCPGIMKRPFTRRRAEYGNKP